LGFLNRHPKARQRKVSPPGLPYDWRPRLLLALFQFHGISATDFAALQHRRIDPNIGPVVLDSRTQNARIFREITLRECCHHAARAGSIDTQPNCVPEREDLPNPGILHKIRFAVFGSHHNIGPKTPDLEAALRIEGSQPV
jgi:hypothetical protein